ncbi:MAG: tRNA-binding protein [Candidatus Rokubacteria bacterium]|nr:tRNA-binding protein [Candidatus Rokubacteria bacterium]
MKTIAWSDFEKVNMRVGVVVDAKEFPEAKKPAYRLWVDLGPLGVKRSSAQLTHRYRVEELIGRQVVCVVNFPPKQVGPFVSELLVMGAYTERGEVVLLRPDSPVTPGSKIG